MPKTVLYGKNISSRPSKLSDMFFIQNCFGYICITYQWSNIELCQEETVTLKTKRCNLYTFVFCLCHYLHRVDKHEFFLKTFVWKWKTTRNTCSCIIYKNFKIKAENFYFDNRNSELKISTLKKIVDESLNFQH